jgi:TAG lipase/steryl ester hydrolase/phospholipase A2/LPA acyltransferase
MSFLSDALFSGGSTRLHAGRKAIRKTKSHGGLLTPFAQLVKGPLEVLNNAVTSDESVSSEDTIGATADRKQILYLRMKDVSAVSLDVLSNANGTAGHIPR